MTTLATHLVIDGDTHIEEHPAVWEYMDKEFAPRKPVAVAIDTIPDRPKRDVHWFIDGAIFPRTMGHGQSIHGSPVLTKYAKAKPATIEEQAILTAAARLRAMDRHGVDVHVVYPTVFLQNLTRDLRYEAALMRSYNDYAAERTADSGGRLRWIGTVPIRDVQEAERELRRCHSKGASGVMLLCSAGDQLLHDRAFDPFWAAAEKLQVPVCCHLGWGHDGLLASCDTPATAVFVGADMALVMALFSFVAGGIFDRFPHLKVGLIEGGVDWFPVALKRMKMWRHTQAGHPWPARHEPEHYLAECQIYFGAGGDEEDLPSLIKVLGEGRLIGGQDFPHTHFQDDQLGHSFTDLVKRDDVSDVVKRKIMCDNSAAFYGINIAQVQRRAGAKEVAP
jgi:predicted TIM-barrel fold metal-dependent hydrolase